MQIHALAAGAKGAALTPFEYQAPELGPHDVLVKVRANSRRAAVEAALKRLKDEGKIKDYLNDFPEEKVEAAGDEEDA